MKDFEDRIDAYLRNELNSTEKEQFESEVKENIELQNQFNEIYELRQGIKYGELAEASNALRDLEKKISKKEKNNHLKKWILALVTLALLVIAISFFLIKNTEENSEHIPITSNIDAVAFDKYIYHHDSRSIHTPSNMTSAQETAYNQYSIRSFKSCIPKLQNLWTLDNDTLAYYYLGVSYFYVNEEAKARKILTSPFLQDYNNPIK